MAPIILSVLALVAYTQIPGTTGAAAGLLLLAAAVILRAVMPRKPGGIMDWLFPPRN